MTVTKLRPNDSTICAAGLLQIDWQIRGATVETVHVEMQTLNGAGTPAPAVQTIGRQGLMLASLPEPVALVARPRSVRAAFTDGVTFQTQISLPASDADADQIVLTPVDVSGTSSAVLFTVAPAPGGWKVTAAPAGQSPTPYAPASQPPPATPDGPDSNHPTSDPQTATVATVRRAMYAARRHVGASTLPADQLITIAVAVDRSASMLPHQRSGALQAILELILGVNTVCGANRSIPVWKMSHHPCQMRPDLSESSIAGYVETVLDDQALTSGTVLAPLVEQIPRNANRQIVFVITDDVPPDMNATAAAMQARRDPPETPSWHLIVLARHRSDPAVRTEPWRDELRPLAPLVDDGLITMSAITPDDSPDWLADRLTSSDELDAVVAALGIRPATTTAEAQ